MPTILPRCALITALAHAAMPGAAVAQPTTGATAFHGCTVSGCGSNTPVLFGTPIVGLSLEGKSNADGFRLDPILKGPPRPSASCPGVTQQQLSKLRLGIVKGKLVGKLGNSDVCVGDQMIGMVFTIRVEKCGDGNQACEVSVRITETGSIATWENPRRPAVPTYRLVWHKLPDPWPSGVGAPEAREEDSVCPRREAWMDAWQQVKPPTPDPWHDPTDHLILVQGETYTRGASIDHNRSGAGWFNLACVGTALAKMRLLGYDPMAGPTQENERQATLKMLTARYRGETSYTKAGMPLMWEHRDHRTLEGTPAGGWHRDVRESYWNADGAMCLSHRRTWRDHPLRVPTDGGNLAITVKMVGDQLRAAIQDAMPEADPPPELPLPACARTPGSINLLCRDAIATLYPDRERKVIDDIYGTPRCSSAPSDYVWVTYPVDHVAHPAPPSPR